MEARKIIGSAVLAAWALILSAGTAAGQYKSKIDVLKGEKWWGVFVTGEQMMPLEKPFPQTDLSTWVKSQATPFLVSSRGRYIWSREPFKIEFTGSGFLIDSPVEQVEAVTGGKTLREAYLVCCHRNFPPKEGNGVPAEGFFTAPLYDMTGEIPFGATAGQIRDFAESLLASGYPSGTLVVPSGWQQTIGSFTPSWNEYGDFAALARELHERGFPRAADRHSVRQRATARYSEPIATAELSSGCRTAAAIAEWAGRVQRFLRYYRPAGLRHAARPADRIAGQLRGRRVRVRLRGGVALCPVFAGRDGRVPEKVERIGARVRLQPLHDQPDEGDGALCQRFADGRPPRLGFSSAGRFQSDFGQSARFSLQYGPGRSGAAGPIRLVSTRSCCYATCSWPLCFPFLRSGWLRGG